MLPTEPFKTIKQATIATMVTNFTETVDNVAALETHDIAELAEVCQIIGRQVRARELPGGRGLLVLARLIIESANDPSQDRE